MQTPVGPVSAAPPGMPLAGDLLHSDHSKPGQRPAAAGLPGLPGMQTPVGPVSTAPPGVSLASDLLHRLQDTLVRYRIWRPQLLSKEAHP